MPPNYDRVSLSSVPLRINDLFKLGSAVAAIVVATYTVLQVFFPPTLAAPQVQAIASSSEASSETQSHVAHQAVQISDLQRDVHALTCITVALRARIDAERKFLPTTGWADREVIRGDAARNALASAGCEVINGSR